MALIEIRDVHKIYHMGGTNVHALDGVSLQIDSGEFVAIMGPSGSGKSTLMHILGLLDSPDQGTYRLDGKDVSVLPENEMAFIRACFIGFVFQQFNLLHRISARENVALPRIYTHNPSSATPEQVLERVGLGDRLTHTPNELSGGQQQRVAIARSLINNPPIIMADEPTGNLDSSSSDEVMRLFRELNQSGLTVVVVTHDPDVAEHARRVVTLRDGRIVRDTGDQARVDVSKDKAGQSSSGQEASHTQGRGTLSPIRQGLWVAWRSRLNEGSAMLLQAARALGVNKLRTFLSMLGVLIGVAAVIVVMALGTGAKIDIEERIAAMGANLLVLRPGSKQSRGVALEAGAVSRLALSDVEAVLTELPTVDRVAPTVSGAVQVTRGSQNWRTQVIGTSPSYAGMHDNEPAFGRFFSDEEVLSRARVAVIGLTVAQELFKAENPVGKTIRVNRVSFEIIGVLPEKGSSFHRDPNDQIIIPVTTAMRRLLGRDYVDVIEMQVNDCNQMEYTELAAVDLMMKRHGIPSGDQDAFSVFNLADIQKTMSETSNTMALLLTGISAISLVVGGIGIMNIMLVSVTERTREIGIRKAVGAKRSSILAQFLVESIVVSACGGVIGIFVGWAASFAMSRLAGWSVAITLPTILAAFSFSAAVGVVFGLWPARKASSLQPIKALRYE